MTLRVHLWSATYATVHTAPNWFEWLLGQRESDEGFILSCGAWFCETDGRLVDDIRVIAALERSLPVL